MPKTLRHAPPYPIDWSPEQERLTERAFGLYNAWRDRFSIDAPKWNMLTEHERSDWKAIAEGVEVEG